MKASPSTMRVAKSSVATLLPAFLVAGCILGPNYKKPELTLPDSFRSQITASDATSFADLPWWSVFGDTALQGLVTEALANNNDLQIAVARIEQARAMVGVSESQGKPQIGYQASAVGEKGLVLQQNGSVGPLVYGAFEGLLNATWELDIWGRIRRSTEAARANLLAQQDVRRGVILTLVSDLAADYFRLLELDRELAIAEESARVYKDTLGLFTTRFDAGRDSKLPVDRTQANYDSSNANIQDLRREITQQENAISTLVGAYPKAIQRGHPLTEQSTPETPLGTTTAVLQRRPDILQAEQNIISANAEIGVAVADRFPKVGLSAFVGGQGIVTDSWAGFGVWNAALSAAGPIYTGGRLEEVYHQRQAYWDETVAQYKQKVVVAFQETSDALVARQTLTLRRTALESQVRALRSSSDLALMRYQAGRAAYFEVLEAQQQLFPAESALAQTQRDQLVAVVNLYKALGGGWNADEAKPTEPAANAPPMQGPAERGDRQ